MPKVELENGKRNVSLVFRGNQACGNKIIIHIDMANIGGSGAFIVTYCIMVSGTEYGFPTVSLLLQSAKAPPPPPLLQGFVGASGTVCGENCNEKWGGELLNLPPLACTKALSGQTTSCLGSVTLFLLS